MKAISISKAIKLAVDRHFIYRQGHGWISSSWDERVRAYRISHEHPHSIARAQMVADRAVEATLALRPDADSMRIAWEAQQLTGSLRERVMILVARIDAAPLRYRPVY